MKNDSDNNIITMLTFGLFVVALLSLIVNIIIIALK